MIYMCVHPQARQVMVINWDLWERVGHEHTVNCLEKGVEITLVSGRIELILFRVS